MKRVNVYDEWGDYAGWFNLETAEVFKEQAYWDGSDYVSVNTNHKWTHEQLYRTKGGRWVLEYIDQTNKDNYQIKFIDEDEAKEWLERNDEPEAIKKYFSK